MKARAQFDQRGYLSAHDDLASCRPEDTGNQLQQSALARSISANDSDRLARMDLEAHVPQNREFLEMGALLKHVNERITQRVGQLEDHSVTVLHILKEY